MVYSLLIQNIYLFIRSRRPYMGSLFRISPFSPAFEIRRVRLHAKAASPALGNIWDCDAVAARPSRRVADSRPWTIGGDGITGQDRHNSNPDAIKKN